MDGRRSAGHGWRRVVVAVVLLLVLFAVLAVGAPVAFGGGSPSATGQPAVAEAGSSNTLLWLAAGVLAFVGGGFVVWLKQRNDGRR